jgi:hypothetical protein
MQDVTSSSPKSQPVLYQLAKHPHAYYPIPKAEARSETSLQGEPFSSDIHAFCALIARIIIRCLQERDERVLTVLSLSRKHSDTKE